MTRFLVRTAPGAAIEDWPGRLGVPARHGIMTVEAHLHRGAAALINSEGSDRSADYPGIIDDLRRLPANDLILVGSIGRGRSARLRVDDLLHLYGFGLRGVAPTERHRLMRALLAETDASHIVPARVGGE